MPREFFHVLIPQQTRDKIKDQRSFTLIELLIVLGILAVIATVAILVLNPLELIKQARDTQRMADLTTLNKALAVYQSSGQTSLGSATTVYVSVPANQTNCSDLGLPSLPTGYVYACVTSSTLQKVDGTGWIPLLFSSVSYGTPLEKLPIDPVNTTSSRNYYTYIPGGSWEMATRFESDKYTPQAGKDGGLDPATYEKGTDLTLAPFMGGMIGWWKFDESGSVVNDSSGFGKNGTMYVSSTPTDNHTSSGCKAGTCANFSGTNYYISILGTNYNVSNGYSMTAWFKPNALGAGSNIFLGSYSVPAYLSFHTAGSALFQSAQISSTQKTLSGVNPVSTGNWYFTAGTFNGSTLTTYLNGSYESSASYPGSGSLGSGICLGGYNCTIGYWTNGSVDDVRIYNRALSAAEIAAIYNATK